MTFTKKDQSDHELDLKGKIKNLQVSNSIFRKEMADIDFKLGFIDPEINPELVEKLQTRYHTLQSNIYRKEQELIPLKEESAKKKAEQKLLDKAIKEAKGTPKTAEEILEG